MLLETIGSVWSGHGSSGPRAFFLNSEPGFYLDFSATAPLYQDNLAASPLTLPDQSVGLAADRSRARSPITVAAAVQASLGLRPKWGRAPVSRRNVLNYTRQFDNFGWARINQGTGIAPVVTPNAGLDPDGNMTATRVQLNSGGNGSEDYSLLRQSSSSWPNTAIRHIWVKSNTGANQTITLVATSPASKITVTPTWQQFKQLAGSSDKQLDISVGGTANTGATADILVWHPQYEAGSTDTPYQEVTTVFDITESGVPSYGFARFDRSDDILSATIPAAQTGDVLVFGRNGSWIESNVTYGAGSTWSIGVNTVTGLPTGLLAAIGDIVGVVAIGRTLTATERTMALNYYKARGAAGLLVAGAELVTNGDNEAGVAVAPVDGLTNFTAKVQSADRAQSGAYSAKLTANATSGSHYWVLKNIGAAEAIQVSGWAFVPTGATAGQSLKLVDIFDGSFVPEIVPNAGKYDQWVYFKAVRPAKGTAWTLSLGQDTAANWAGGSIYIDGLSIKNLTVTP